MLQVNNEEEAMTYYLNRGFVIATEIPDTIKNNETKGQMTHWIEEETMCLMVLAHPPTKTKGEECATIDIKSLILMSPTKQMRSTRGIFTNQNGEKMWMEQFYKAILKLMTTKKNNRLQTWEATKKQAKKTFNNKDLVLAKFPPPPPINLSGRQLEEISLTVDTYHFFHQLHLF